MQNKHKPGVIFIGSGKIAIPSLAKIANSPQIELKAVLTQEDKPAGRKLHLKATPLAEWAEKNKIRVKKIKSINSTEIIAEIRALQPDFYFLASFGQILREEVLSIPRIEPLNLHASLLPDFRGAAPIQAAILSGANETGVSFMRMEKGLDTGPVFAKFATSIMPDDNAETLEHKLGELAAQHVVEVILGIFNGSLKPHPQEHSKASLAHKIEKKDGIINWNDDAAFIERKIRAYYPWPGAFSEFEIFGKKYRLKIVKAKVVDELPDLAPGNIKLTKDKFIVACGKNALQLEIIHPDGRKEMPAADFIHGFHKHL